MGRFLSMNVSLIKKNQKFVEYLPNCWWLSPKYRNTKKSQKFLKDIYERELHLLCSCTGHALMFVRKVGCSYVLVNHAAKGFHAKTCLLKTEISGEINASDNSGCAYNEPILRFELHHEANEITETTVNRDGNQNTVSSKKDKLHNLLMQLLHDSFSNVFYIRKKTHEIAALASIRKAAHTIEFGSGTLDKYIFYGTKGEMMAESSLRTYNWGGPRKRHSFLLEIVTDIKRSGNRLELDGHEYYYSNVSQPGNDMTHGPYVCLSSIVLDEDNEAFRHSIVIKPVVSCLILMPIDSNYERKSALSLIEQIRSAGDEFPCTLSKPIKPRISDTGDYLLPDFVLNIKDKDNKLVDVFLFEIMGFESDVYVERKNRLIPEMKKAWQARKVFEISGKNSEQEIINSWREIKLV